MLGWSCLEMNGHPMSLYDVSPDRGHFWCSLVAVGGIDKLWAVFVRAVFGSWAISVSEILWNCLQRQNSVELRQQVTREVSVVANRRCLPDVSRTCGWPDARVSEVVAHCLWLACTWTRSWTHLHRPQNDHRPRRPQSAWMKHEILDYWSPTVADSALRRDDAGMPWPRTTRSLVGGWAGSGVMASESDDPVQSGLERRERTRCHRLWPSSSRFAVVGPTSHDSH